MINRDLIKDKYVAQLLGALLGVLNAKSPDLSLHTEVTADVAVIISRTLELTEDATRGIYATALCHDVGKLKVGDKVLNKRGNLSGPEREVIRHHPQWGSKIVDGLPSLKEFVSGVDIMDAICAHHEEPDGSGYPRGLKNSDIPFVGKIVAVADRFTALVYQRPYKPAYSVGRSLEILYPLTESFFNGKAPAVLDSLSRYKLPETKVSIGFEERREI